MRAAYLYAKHICLRLKYVDIWRRAKLHPWRIFTLIQISGALCQAVLPYVVGNVAMLPFLSLLAGLVLLLPGSVITVVLMRLVYPTPLTPRTEELLALLIAVALNCVIFPILSRIRWRPMFGSGLRLWLLVAGMSNAVALAFMWLWFPGAGLDGLFELPHVQRVVASIALTALAVAVVAVAFLVRRGFKYTSWAVLLIHFVRLLPVTQAMKTWPGGDDGSGMGWVGIVIPFAWILALVGVASYIWGSRRSVPHEEPAVSEVNVGSS